MAYLPKIQRQRIAQGLDPSTGLKSGATPKPEAAKPSKTEAPKTLQHYEAALSADIAKLAAIKDINEKLTVKKALLPTYRPFIEAYINNGDNYPNDVVIYGCIWLFDVFDIEPALALGLHLVKQGTQIMPQKFDRDLPTFMADAMYDWANALLKAEQSALPYLESFVAESMPWDLHPAVKSKNVVMLAKHKARVKDWQTCYNLCVVAENINPTGAGVKTLKLNAQTHLNRS